MPQFTFYDIAGDPSHKALGLETFSPEECQLYESALAVEIPEGSHLVVRRRRLKSGRLELLVGVVKIGEPLLLKGEDGGDAIANPAPAVPRALDIPEGVAKASEDELETMAAVAGIVVDERWKKKNRALRNAEVARKMGERRKAVAGV